MTVDPRREQLRVWHPYISPQDPCPPIPVKTYIVPPNVTAPFQPPGLPQFSPYEALRLGTLWPAYYSPYEPKRFITHIREEERPGEEQER
ncbi:spore coat associated protein CotJA [Paenibacillus chartarius]|uniref:Spore coat associated protein CotJA n=1 Tax=Paenibacillus chartarius TaxID=747481 RepID=A0ABV6DN21_9BACL